MDAVPNGASSGQFAGGRHGPNRSQGGLVPAGQERRDLLAAGSPRGQRIRNSRRGRGYGSRRTRSLCRPFLPAASLTKPASPASPEEIEFFEGRVRPALANYRHACHPDRIEPPFGGFRLDSREAAFNGSDSRPALVPGWNTVMAMLRGEPVLMPCPGT